MKAAAILAPGGGILLAEERPVVETGVYGFNACLIALSLPAFFHIQWNDGAGWVMLVAAVGSTVVLTRLAIAFVPFPTMAAPFLITFWVLFPLAPKLGAPQPIALEPAGQAAFQPFEAVLNGLSGAIFCVSVWSGLLYLGGVLVSNWRHGLLALSGAAIGAGVAAYHHAPGSTINSGLYGFNGVLTAVSVFVFCGGMLRLSILGAVVATVLMEVFPAVGLQTLSAPFVLATWVMLALGWVERHGFNVQSTTGPPAAPPTQPGQTSRPPSDGEYHAFPQRSDRPFQSPGAREGVA
jgi:urea transporter